MSFASSSIETTGEENSAMQIHSSADNRGFDEDDLFSGIDDVAQSPALTAELLGQSGDEEKDCNVNDIEGETTDADSADQDEVILSLYWRNGKIGASTYSLQNPVIYVLNDIPDDFTFGFKVVRSLFLQVQPTQVVTCKSMPQRFIFYLNNLLLGEEEAVDQSLHANLHVFPEAEFKNDNCLSQIFAMRLPGEPDDWPEEEHKKYIHSLLDTSQDSMINSVARLLKYINGNLTLMYLSHQEHRILGIRNLCLDQQVWLSSETYCALQIFTHTAHPSLFKWTAGAHKEGLSVYGLFNRCQSKLGSKFLRAILLQPTSNLEELTKRHEVIEFCINPAHADIVQKMQSCLRQVQNVSAMLPKLFAAQATIPQWKSLKKTIHSVLLLREMCRQFANAVPFFEEGSSIISEDLHRVAQLMDTIIDFQTSEQLKRFVVLPGVDIDLDRMKHAYENLDKVMMEVNSLELQDLPEYMHQSSVLFLPEIGFLLCVPMWKDNISSEEINVPGFKFKFIANKMIHYKSQRCKELDTNFGDLYLRISESELDIMLTLVQFVQQHIDSLLDSLGFVGELDCYIALAEVASGFEYVKPKMTKNHEILIEKGRHPLQEHCVSHFVPNDFISSSNQDLVKVLTGPNTSGKSVYLKQVAMIAYLAHTGSYVPAKKAVFGVLDQIHTRIQTTESAASSLSAFSIDLRQMNTAYSMSTRSSLLVIDEFGKGTSVDDGLSLLTSFLINFLKRGPLECPHIILSTHFHRLFDFLEENPLVQTYVLEHIVSDGELVYLYQLKTGFVKKSLAIEVARTSGVPDSQIKEAHEILDALQSNLHVKPTTSHKKMTLSKNQEAVTADFLTNNIEQYEELEEFRQNLLKI